MASNPPDNSSQPPIPDPNPTKPSTGPADTNEPRTPTVEVDTPAPGPSVEVENTNAANETATKLKAANDKTATTLTAQPPKPEKKPKLEGEKEPGKKKPKRIDNSQIIDRPPMTNDSWKNFIAGIMTIFNNIFNLMGGIHRLRMNAKAEAHNKAIDEEEQRRKEAEKKGEKSNLDPDANKKTPENPAPANTSTPENPTPNTPAPSVPTPTPVATPTPAPVSPTPAATSTPSAPAPIAQAQQLGNLTNAFENGTRQASPQQGDHQVMPAAERERNATPAAETHQTTGLTVMANTAAEIARQQSPSPNDRKRSGPDY